MRDAGCKVPLWAFFRSGATGSRKLVKGRVKVICRRAAKLLPTFPTHRRISPVSFLIARAYLEKFDRK